VFGSDQNVGTGGGSAGNETVGPMGDTGITGDTAPKNQAKSGT